MVCMRNSTDVEIIQPIRTNQELIRNFGIKSFNQKHNKCSLELQQNRQSRRKMQYCWIGERCADIDKERYQMKREGTTFSGDSWREVCSGKSTDRRETPWCSWYGTIMQSVAGRDAILLEAGKRNLQQAVSLVILPEWEPFGPTIFSRAWSASRA